MTIHLHKLDAAAVRRVSISQIAEAPNVKARNVTRIEAGTSLFHQGDAGTNAIFLIKGTMCSYRITKDGDRLINGFMLSGEIFRHSYDGVRVNSVDAISDCIFQRLTPTDLDALGAAGTHSKQLDRLPHEGWKMTSDLLNRLHMSGDQRVAHFILDFAQRSNAASDNSPFNLQMSRAEIASYLGLTTETVVRSLKRLAVEGMFTAITPHDYRIRDLKRLRELADI